MKKEKVIVLLHGEESPETFHVLSALPLRVEYVSASQLKENYLSDACAFFSTDSMTVKQLSLLLMKSEAPIFLFVEDKNVPLNFPDRIFLIRSEEKNALNTLNSLFKKLNLPFLPFPLQGKNVGRDEVFKIFKFLWENQLTARISLEGAKGQADVNIFSGQIAIAGEKSSDALSVLTILSKVLSTQSLSYEVKPCLCREARILESWHVFLTRLAWFMDLEEILEEVRDIYVELAETETIGILPLRGDEAAFLTSLVPGIHFTETAKSKGLSESLASRLIWVCIHLGIVKKIKTHEEEKEEAGLPELVEEEEPPAPSPEDFESLDFDDKEEE